MFSVRVTISITFHLIFIASVCQQGMYGANCQSECHCAEGVSCLLDTGECDGGQCHHDWYGVNCQSKFIIQNVYAMCAI